MQPPKKKNHQLPTGEEQKSDPQRIKTGKSVSKPKDVPPEDNTRRDKRPNRRPSGSSS